MRNRLSAALVLLALATTPAGAELKYTFHMEVKQGDPAAAANPMMAMVSQQFTKMVPPGGADLIYTVGEQGIRVEYLQAAMGQPAGTVVVSRKGGEMVAMQPTDKTYWRIVMPDVGASLAQAGMTPKTSVKQTGEFAEFGGMRAERLTFEWSIDIPIPEEARASLPEGFPTALSMTGDNWIATDKKFEKYASMIAGNKAIDFLATLGLEKLAASGITLKSIVRFAGTEIHGEVTKISEEPAPAGYLDIPEGFKEIPPPQAAIR